MAPMREMMVGRYALVRRIATGGMAEVWSGKVYGSSGFEKVVAVKLLALCQADKEAYLRALTDEALIQGVLKHPNIVEIYDFNIDCENPYMVMEYVEGIELREIIRALREGGRTAPFKLVAHIISEVSQALTYAHERRHPDTGRPLAIVHRDVTPSNILLSVHGEVKLSDFGIAKSALQSQATQVGEIKGKFRYMSPEQARGDPIDYRSDVYSLGLVFYEACFGAPAYEGEADSAILMKAQRADVKMPQDIDPGLHSIFLRLLASWPEGRYGDLKEFRDELNALAASQDGTANREDMRAFLAAEDLPKMKAVIHAAREARDWAGQTAHRILDRTGVMEISPPAARRRRRLYYALTALALTAVLTGLFMWGLTRSSKPPDSGSLRITTSPAGARVLIRYGSSRREGVSPLLVGDLPFGVAVQVNISKDGFRSEERKAVLSALNEQVVLDLALSRTANITANFTADPYAEVTIPGQFARIETPFKKTLPAGQYDVKFVHGHSGRQAEARLDGRVGGNFVCSADMAPSEPTAQCRKK